MLGSAGALIPQALVAALMLLLLEGRVCRLLSSARACASASWPWALLGLGKATQRQCFQYVSAGAAYLQQHEPSIPQHCLPCTDPVRLLGVASTSFPIALRQPAGPK